MPPGCSIAYFLCRPWLGSSQLGGNSGSFNRSTRQGSFPNGSSAPRQLLPQLGLNSRQENPARLLPDHRLLAGGSPDARGRLQFAGRPLCLRHGETGPSVRTAPDEQLLQEVFAHHPGPWPPRAGRVLHDLQPRKHTAAPEPPGLREAGAQWKGEWVLPAGMAAGGNFVALRPRK